MKFRVRLGKERFVVQVNHENGTVENLKEAICNERSIRYAMVMRNLWKTA